MRKQYTSYPTLSTPSVALPLHADARRRRCDDQRLGGPTGDRAAARAVRSAAGGRRRSRRTDDGSPGTSSDARATVGGITTFWRLRHPQFLLQRHVRRLALLSDRSGGAGRGRWRRTRLHYGGGGGAGGVFCPLRTKRCRRVPSLSLSVSAATAIPPAMVAPVPLTAWWQMAERLVNAVVVMAGQAALGMRVDLDSGMQFQ